MFEGLLPMMVLDLVLPAAILFAAIVSCQNVRGRPVREAKGSLILAATYSAWMFVWSAAIMFGTGSVGPCGSNAPELWLGIVVAVPSLVWGLVLKKLIGSSWMLAAPFVGDALMLGIGGAIGLAQGRSVLETAWLSPWNPYAWLVAVIGLGAWRVMALRPHPAWACQSCWYDRRGLGQDVVCPECGTVPGVGPSSRGVT